MMDLVTLVLACSLYADAAIPYAMIQTGSKNNPLFVRVDNATKHFNRESEAVRYTQQQIKRGKTVAIGLMQLSSQWLPTLSVPVVELFRPCKNLVLATQMLNTIHQQCQTLAESDPTLSLPSCVLSVYKTGSAYAGLAYATQVMDYATKHPFSALVKKAREPSRVAAATLPDTALHSTV